MTKFGDKKVIKSFFATGPRAPKHDVGYCNYLGYLKNHGLTCKHDVQTLHLHIRSFRVIERYLG